MNEKWPTVIGRTVEETVARARQLNPAAGPEEVRRSRGAVVVSFRNARGDFWQDGGPGVAFRNEQ